MGKKKTKPSFLGNKCRRHEPRELQTDDCPSKRRLLPGTQKYQGNTLEEQDRKIERVIAAMGNHAIPMAWGCPHSLWFSKLINPFPGLIINRSP